MATQTKLDEFTRAYIEALLWSSTDDDDCPLDKNYDVSDFDDDTLAAIIADCAEFRAENAKLIERAEEYDSDEGMGHDYWLTRNGHGAGYWDGDYPDAIGDALTLAAKARGERWPYVGDDGKIYLG
jgi:hypothetical protein